MASGLELDTLDTVTEWLRVEHDYQFDARQLTHSTHPNNSRSYIIGLELPTRWDKFQKYHNQFRYDADPEFNKSRIDPKVVLHVGQSILKVAGAAHSAFVWDALSRKMNVEEAADLSWTNLDKYRSLAADDKLAIPSKEYLEPHKTIEQVVNRITGKEEAYDLHSNALMLTCAGLAVAALMEVRSTEKAKYILPAPGFPSGHLEPWNYKS